MGWKNMSDKKRPIRGKVIGKINNITMTQLAPDKYAAWSPDHLCLVIVDSEYKLKKECSRCTMFLQ